MRAILIDTTTRMITEVQCDGGIHDIYRSIGADCFDCVRMGDEHENTIYVDDEGLINGKARTDGMFRVDGENPAYLAGKGLILATDSEGHSAPCTLDIEEVRKRFAFGEVIRLRGQLIFLELKQDEEVGPIAAMNNRMWKVDN